MNFYGNQWILIEINEYIYMQIYMSFNENISKSMNFHEDSWKWMNFYWIQWISIEIIEFQSKYIRFNENKLISLESTKINEILWKSMNFKK